MAENNFGRRILVALSRLFRLVWAWVVKFTRTRFHGCRRCKAQKRVNERLERLGSEIYSMYKRDETDFMGSSDVQRQLKMVEEAETRLFEVYDRIEEIENDYRRKKQQIAESGKSEADQE